MDGARFLTPTDNDGRFGHDEADGLTGVARRPVIAQADGVALEDGPHRRQPSLSMSPQAAAVLPLMLALARLQARRALTEQAQ